MVDGPRSESAASAALSSVESSDAAAPLSRPGIGGLPPTPGDAPAAVEAARFVSYALLAAAGAALFVRAGDLPSSRWEPLGAGAFPRLVLALLVVLCLMAMAGSARVLIGRSGFSRMAAWTGHYIRARRLVVTVFAALALYLWAMRPLGFGLSTFLFLLAAEFAIAPRRWTAWAISLVVALVFSFGLQFLFAEVFNVFLPRGPWGF